MPRRHRFATRGLACARVGTTHEVTHVDLDARARLRLAELGVRRGTRLTVLGRTAGDGRLVGIGTTRIALDRQTLGHVGSVALADAS